MSKHDLEMKRTKCYSEIILGIVREAYGVAKASAERSGGMVVVSDNGIEFHSELYEGNVMLHSIHGVSKLQPTAEEQERAKSAIADAVDGATLYINPIVERGGALIQSLMVTLPCKWMGLKKFRREADGLPLKMTRFAEVLKLHFSDVEFRKIDVDPKATHKLLMSGE